MCLVLCTPHCPARVRWLTCGGVAVIVRWSGFLPGRQQCEPRCCGFAMSAVSLLSVPCTAGFDGVRWCSDAAMWTGRGSCGRSARSCRVEVRFRHVHGVGEVQDKRVLLCRFEDVQDRFTDLTGAGTTI